MTPRFLIMFALSALAVGSAPAHAASLPANTTAILSGDSSLFGELPAPMGSAFSTHQAVSQDGRFIAFDSGADGLSSEDDNSVDNVFVKDTTTGAVTLVSRRSGATGAPSHDQCFDAAISDDGTRVAFTCNGPLDDADTNGHEDVYVRDLTTDQTILVSRKSNQGDLGNGDSFSPSVNQDGTVVAYTSFASNLAGIDVESVYATNLTSHTTTLVSDPPGTTNPPNDTSEHPSVSDDGNLIAFDSRASNFAGDDNNGAPDVFVRNMTTGGVVLASRASGQTGDVGNETSSDPALAGDGSAVAFESSAFNLAPTIDSNGDTDVYVRSLTGNTTSIVDAVGTTKANSFASQPAIDDNGDVVTFQSPATNLGALAGPDGRPAVFAAKLGGTITLASRGDGAGGELATDAEDSSVSGNGRQVVFDSVGSVTGADLPGIETISLRNLAADTTIDVARPPGDAPFDNQAGNSAGGSMSADGRFVAFQSSAPGLGVPPGVETAIVVRDTVTGATVIASRADGPDGAPMTNAIEPSISADGKRVAFVESPAQGSSHVWVRDLATGSTILADRANGGDGAIADGDSDVPSIDGAGDRVAFESDADNLDPDDTDTTFDIFVRDLTTDSTTLASRAVNGDKSNDSSFDPSISATGDHVAFDTFATNLGDGDTDDKQDIHVRDLAEGTTRLASVNTQGEKGDQRSTEASISGDGSRVAFESDATNFGPVPPTTEVWVHDFNTGSTTLASRDDGADGAPASLEAFGPLLSSDGKVVAYSLESGVGELRPAAAPRLHPRGILGQLFFQSFRRDLAANTTALVSRAAGPDGAPADTGVAVGITSDGACVSFDASGGLLGDVPGAEDFDQVYMRTFAADCGRPQTPPPPARDTTAPVLRRVSLTHTKFRVARAATSIGAKRHTKLHRGTQLRFTSSEAAKLTLLIQRAGPGRKLRKGHKSICKPVHSRPKHKACTAYRRTATLTRNIKVGRGQVALSGRIGRRRMAPGHYRLTLTATDGAGNRSKPVRRSFTILAG